MPEDPARWDWTPAFAPLINEALRLPRRPEDNGAIRLFALSSRNSPRLTESSQSHHPLMRAGLPPTLSTRSRSRVGGARGTGVVLAACLRGTSHPRAPCCGSARSVMIAGTSRTGRARPGTEVPRNLTSPPGPELRSGSHPVPARSMPDNALSHGLPGRQPSTPSPSPVPSKACTWPDRPAVPAGTTSPAPRSSAPQSASSHHPRPKWTT